MTASYSFLFQKMRELTEADMAPFRDRPALTLVRTGRTLLVLEGPEPELLALGHSLGADWVWHRTSTTPFPGPSVGHPVPFPEELAQLTMPRTSPTNEE